MNRFYVACDLGKDQSRVVLGTLHKEHLTISEVRRFANEPIQEKGEWHWNIPQLYQEVMEGLRSAGSYDEPVDSLSCTSWGGDYLLFQSDGTLITPSYLPSEARTAAGMKTVNSKIGPETVYEETGSPLRGASTLVQLAAETGKRIKHAGHLLPLGDAFNFLLSGVPRIETSQASATLLYNPTLGTWSEKMLSGLRIPAQLLPQVVDAGTVLGPVRQEVAKETRMQETQVVASCSHGIAAALAGLPIGNGETWAFLRSGPTAFMGTQVPAPVMNELSRDSGFVNEIGFGGSTCFYKPTLGFWMLDECQRVWEKESKALDPEMLGHLAGSGPAFESLIDPTDPRFQTAGDMPLKIQAFCKETDQPVPRKPGPIFRCILESLALQYRKVLREVAYLTGSEVKRVYVFGDTRHGLLNHFIANALQLPVVVVPDHISAVGNIVVQALALGHLESLGQARALIRSAVKMETITPHATAWSAAYDRFVALHPKEAVAD